MNEFLKILTMTRHHLYCSVINPKIWAAMIIIVSAVFKVVFPFARIGEDYNKPVNFSAAAIPFLSNYSILLIFCALLLIFSDMPFSDPQQVFAVTRGGKRSWHISQLLFIIAASVLISMIEILISWIIIFVYVTFENSWGAVENSISQSGDLLIKYEFVGYFSNNVISNVSPLRAFTWSTLIGTFIYTVFGTLIYALNSITRKMGGIICGTILVGYQALMWNFIHPKYKWLAVLSWGNLDYIDIQHNSLYPTSEFVIGMLSGMYMISAAIILINFRKRTDIL